MAMVQFDSHSDTNCTYFGDKPYTHGTPFCWAIEEGLLDPTKIIQVGIRGSLYSANDLDWALDQGIRVIDIEEYFEIGPYTVVSEIHKIIGDTPT